MAWAIAVLLFLAALYLFLIAPGRRGKDVSPLMGYHYAHRGLFDNGQGTPENSLAAFQRAVDAGYGIELDVQLTKDGQLVVFHDQGLARMCSADVRLFEISFEEANQFALLGTDQRIPLFSDVLRLVNGRVPLIVEIKHYGNAARVAKQAYEALCKYSGPYCVESFHPLAMRWFKKNAPNVVRGQLASGIIGKDASRISQGALKYLLVNALSRPDFIAYDVRSDRNISIFLLRRLFKPLWVGWTVRTEGERQKAQRTFDLQIFEGFLPNH